MKVTLNTSKFRNALSLVNRAIANKPLLPILTNLKFTASKDGTIILTATDLNQQIEISFAGEFEEAGKIALPAKLLNEIITELQTSEITIETIEDRQQIRIYAGKGKYHLAYHSIREFPNLSESQPIKPSIKLPALALLAGIRQVCYAASDDESKQILCGVAIKTNDQKLELAATDGHRMSIASIEVTEELDKTEIIVPIESLITLEKIWATTKSNEAEIDVYLYNNQITFAWKNCAITSRILDGKYPDYNLIIPKTFQRSIVINRKDLLNKVAINKVLCDKSRNNLEIHISQNNQELTLSSSSETSDSNDSIEAIIEGDDLDISFNINYLLDAIKNTNTKQIQFCLNKALEPVVIKPIEDPEKNQPFTIESLNLVMPVQIRH